MAVRVARRHGSLEQELAARLPPGWVTVAIDAPYHGTHPQGSGSGDQLLTLLDFFALGSGSGGGVDGVALRDNWRQATCDKLALLQLMRDGLDVDQDGQQDIDPERVIYLGVSLGGIMSAEFLALTPDITASGLIVPGGRMTDIVQYAEAFKPLIDLVRPADTTDDDLARLWPVLQTVVERGDAVNYAPYLLGERLRGGDQLQLLMAMVLDDAIVPNPANLAYARAAGLPAITPSFVEVGVVPEIGAPPISGNIAGGDATAGVFQFKWIYASGSWRRATHENIAVSDVGIELLTRFAEAWSTTGVGVIVDPFASFGVEQRD